jgi:hypothetical protein
MASLADRCARFRPETALIETVPKFSPLCIGRLSPVWFKRVYLAILLESISN